ncbi:DNA polymerase III subunit psi [Pontibacter sp. 172403-2]|uniref:DNA polymerase III subunit psi n=1 Tax=Pontibacter rufus TaxID=2791028 RepID=UPI0018AF73A8|nr:DNA polymerase III subunit psi [Pontibacter sp. 172403-2]MBF9253741.1 DNA polymerase III subunit psi [Pontibacter sp. 172403-2]
MAGLEADELSMEFLKNFITETLYLVPVNQTAPVPEASETEMAPAKPAQPAAPPVAAQQTTPPPAIPKLPKTEAAAAPIFDISGENQKGVVVLVTLPEQEFRKLPELEFLQKILHAIGLQKADVAYVNNVSGKVARLEELQQKLEVNYIISFASRLDTDLPHDKFTLYNPVHLGRIPVVFAQALSVLEQDVNHKKNLWNALQQVFLS